MKLILGYKQIYDSIHGYIKLSNYACRIIDTPLFQRLRHLHQLGVCHYVFPSATHTRFEHSIGTYHLIHRLLVGIKKNSDPKQLNICLSDYTCELIKIAGLCHDLGHGPFSHVFDHFTANSNHEDRSCNILELIVKDFIPKHDIEFMKTLINPTNEHTGFIYQIVSNKFNGIDYDRFDYYCRDTQMLGLKYGVDYTRFTDDAMVINNNICYPEPLLYEIVSLFKTRYRLHKQIYNHKSVISIQYMMSKIIRLMDPILNITDSLLDMDRFVMLTDDYVLSILKYKYLIEHSDDINVIKAYKILQKIYNREIPKFIGSVVREEPLCQDIVKIISKDTLLHICKIGLVGSNDINPFDNIFLYKTKNKNMVKVNKNKISMLLSNTYQEWVYLVYEKSKHKNYDTIREVLEEL